MQYLKVILEQLKKINVMAILPYLLFAIFFIYTQNRNDAEKREMVTMYTAIQDSTVAKVDKIGRTYYQTSQIQASNPNVFLNVKSSDPAVKALQEEVKQLKNKMTDGSSVTNFSNDIHIDVPTVNGKFSDKWVSIDNSVVDKSIVDIKNKYSIALIEDKGEYVVNVRNDNPYSKSVDSIKTFVKTPRPEKKWSIGAGISYNAKGEILPTIGINYNILKIF